MYSEGIVCPPIHFDVPVSYGDKNPGMRPNHQYGRPLKSLAGVQWEEMNSSLESQLGILPRWVEARPGLFDQVFTCDPGLWINDHVIVSNFDRIVKEYRSGEISHIIQRIKHFHPDTRVHLLSPRARFEAGDCVLVRTHKGWTLVLGYGSTRTNGIGVSEVAAILKSLGIGVLPVRRVTKEFYHLNSVATIYPSANLFTFYAPAFERGARKKLQNALPGVDVHPLPKRWVFRKHPDFGFEYRYSYCLNQIEQSGKSLTCWCHDAYAEFLERRDIEVLERPSGEIERSAGSWRCCVNLHNIIIEA